MRRARFSIPLALALSLLTVASLLVAADGDRPKDIVSFDGTTLVAAARDEQAGGPVIEFIPAGEAIESWTRLASVRVHEQAPGAKELARELVKQVKANYPQSPVAISEDPETDTAVVDFVIWPEDWAFVEFNIFKYYRLEEGPVVAEQYAIRDCDDTEGFLKNELKALRARLLPLMAEEGLRLGEEAGAETAR